MGQVIEYRPFGGISDHQIENTLHDLSAEKSVREQEVDILRQLPTSELKKNRRNLRIGAIGERALGGFSYLVSFGALFAAGTEPIFESIPLTSAMLLLAVTGYILAQRPLREGAFFAQSAKRITSVLGERKPAKAQPKAK